MNGRVLLFTSDRRGGYGGFDIYYALRDDEGNWSDPINMGPLFNTSSDERTVWSKLDYCDEILFSSNRRDLGGHGDLDIYMARLAP